MSGRTSESAGYPSVLSAWWGLAFLVLGYFMLFVDRNILTLLVAPVRRALDINDSEMGILNGYALSVLGGLASVPFAWWADRKSRKATLFVGLLLWGCCTVASGFTTTFTQLLFTRMGLGIAEASLAPAAFSLISDYFPYEKRGRAVGVFGIGGFSGISLSYLIGGMVLASFRGRPTVDFPFVGATSLWHAAFITVGLVTVLLALTALTILEPARQANPDAEAAGAASFFGHLKHHWDAFWLVIGGYMCLGFLAIGWFAWLPSYFIRVFKMPPITAGFELGLVTTLGGVAGAVFGGYVADWLMRRNARGGKLPTLCIMYVIWVPCALGILFSTSPALSLVCAGFFTFADGVGFMQYGNVMQEMFPPHLKARAVAAWTVCSSMLTYGIGPLTFGLATDYLFRGSDGLRLALGIISLPVIAIGFTCAWLGRRYYDRARLASDPSAAVDLDWIAPRALAPAQ